MQAIVTKYISPTNTKSGRIKATCERGSVTIPCPDDADMGEDAHRVALNALLDRFETEDRKRWGAEHRCTWKEGRWVVGGLPRNASHAYAFVMVND